MGKFCLWIVVAVVHWIFRMAELSVYYWGPLMMNMYGRGIGIYLTLDEAGAKYVLKPASDIPEGQSMAPPCIEENGVFMGQTPQILAYLGEKHGLCGDNEAEKMQVMQALGDMDDVFGEHGKFVDDADLLKTRFSFLEKKYSGRKWLGGTSKPTVADFHGVFAFEWVDKKKVDFSAYPSITAWWGNIREHPVVAKMYASCVDGRTMIP